jgi:hypothetical protein
MQKGCEESAGRCVSRGASNESHSVPRQQEPSGSLLRFQHPPPWGPAFAGAQAYLVSVIMLTAALGPAAAQALHACDAIGDKGWTMLATNETTDVKDSAPYRTGNDWFVDRTTTLLPMCNYFNDAGNYSLRSYSLDPVKKTEHIALCHGGTAVVPYVGPCPPK